MLAGALGQRNALWTALVRRNPQSLALQKRHTQVSTHIKVGKRCGPGTGMNTKLGDSCVHYIRNELI